MQQANVELDQSMLYRLVSSLLLFGLLAEWLIPFVNAGEWTQLIQPRAVLVLIGVTLLIGLFQLSLMYNVTITILCGILMMLWLFRGEDQSSWNWLLHFLPNLGHDVTQLVKYGAIYMSDEIRMLLLFTGWLLLTPALQSLVWQHQIAFSIAATTIIFLLILHITLGLDVFHALVRVITWGLLLMALTNFARLVRKLELSSLARSLSFQQWSSILMLVAIIMTSSFMISNQKERSLEPIAWATVFSDSFVEEMSAISTQISGVPLKNKEASTYSANSVGVSGYGNDDAALGQSITASNRVVFHGWTTLGDYWRAEAKSEYNGHGWVDQEQILTLQSIPSDSEQALQTWQSKQVVSGARIRQEIQYEQPMEGMPILQSGTRGLLLQLDATNPDRLLQNYIVGEETSSLYAPTTDSSIKGYSLYTELPITDEVVLKEIEPIENSQGEKLWQADTLSQYLQLPDNLPSRVAALASEVSGGGLTTRYDQVKAIEQYLQSNYSYTLTSSVPEAGEDFVDHFLFQQQEGYCVHFSTAMVVMLRTQGIPARWVKGYHIGEAIDTRQNDAGVVETLYEVKDSDAHAWVEVYFPTIGWVPFDPTPAGAATERDDQGGFMSSLQNVWNQFVTSSTFGTISQLHWKMVIGSLAAVTLVIFLWHASRKLRYVHALLKKYRKAYDSFLINAGLVAQAEERLYEGALPARNRLKNNELQQMKSRMSSHSNELHTLLLKLTQYVCEQSEKKVSLLVEKDFDSTWRNRIGSIQHTIHNSEQQKALNQLLHWIENCSYNNPLIQQYPAPLELKEIIKMALPVMRGERASLSFKKELSMDKHLKAGEHQKG